MADVSTPVEKAADELWNELQRRRVTGLVSVGVRHKNPEILVYVTKINPKVTKAVPTVWRDVPVTLKRSGRMLPAV
ncbi:MAG TPA: hypothetical protein VH062_10195 [Polyangiaceae bacterium]|nr:hypothetical protein [Polyangiaceae bacterium]